MLHKALSTLSKTLHMSLLKLSQGAIDCNSMVEHLPSMCKILDFIPNVKKFNKNKLIKTHSFSLLSS